MSYLVDSVGSDARGEFFAEPETREGWSGFRKLAAALAGLLVMACFAGGLWFAYTLGARQAGGSGAGEIPLIRADERPTKVKPEKPGGMEVPDRDKLIYTQKRAAVEHLLPPPEKPMPRPTAAPPAGARPGLSPPTAPGAAPNPPAAAAAVPAALAKPQPAGKPGMAPTSQPPPAKAGMRRLQLGSVHSEAAAQQEWERVKRANSDVLGNLSATPVRADLGDKGVFYRILTGPVADAERICGELRQRNIGCLIAR